MPETPLKYQLLAELISLLETQQFRFGVDRHLKVQTLWAKLPDDLPIERIKLILCPAIATNQQQQILFYELFDEALKRARAVQAPVAATPTGKKTNRGNGLPWIILITVLLLGIVGVFVWSWVQSKGEQNRVYQKVISLEQGDSTSIERPLELTKSMALPIQEAYLGTDSTQKQTRDSSVFGFYGLLPASDSLFYVAKDSIGTDSFRLTIIDSLAIPHQVLYKVHILQKVETTPTTSPDSLAAGEESTSPPRFTQKTLPRFEEELPFLVIDPPSSLEQFLARHLFWLRWAIIGLSLALLFLVIRYLHKRRQKLIAQLDSPDKPPYVWNIELDPAQDIRLSEGFERMVRALRQRTRQDYFQIDIPKTIAATVEQSGMPTLKYRQQTRPPEYLLLIDRQSAANHRAKLFDWIYRVLKEQEVLVERYFFDGDLRVCFNEKQEQGLSILELQYVHPNARILLFSHGFQLLSGRGGKLATWTRIFEQWKRKTLFSPVPTQQWGRRESHLQEQFFLLPATMQGLQFFADSLEELDELPPGAWKEVVGDAFQEPITLSGDLISSLRQYYPEKMLQWIACCGIYPALHWDLTLALGRELSSEEEPLLSIDRLNSLTRLPWFVEGQIPETARVALIEYLEKEQPTVLYQARLALLDLLQKNPPPTDSSAWDAYQLQVALNEWLSTRDAARKKTLEKEIGQLLEQGVEADWVTIKYLQKPGALDFVVPEQWRKYFYRAGQPGLGWQAWLKDLWWAVPVFLLIAGSCFWYVPEMGCLEEPVQYAGETLCLDAPWKKLLYHKFLAKTAIEKEARDSLLDITRRRDSIFLDFKLTPFEDIPGSKYQQAQQLLPLSISAIDSLQEAEKAHYAFASFNRYVSRYHYNQAVPFANTADSLIRSGEESLFQTYRDSACTHFQEAWPLEPDDPDLQMARRFCSGVQVNILLDENLNRAIGLEVRDSILRFGYPGFVGEAIPLTNSRLRYYHPADSAAAAELLQVIGEQFAFGRDVRLQKVEGNVATGFMELLIDDNQTQDVILTGTVVDSTTNQPISTTQIIWRNQRIATDQQGRFNLILRQPIPNQVRLTIQAPGFRAFSSNFDLRGGSDLGIIPLAPVPAFEVPVVTENDQDGDQIPDLEDRCPKLPGDPNNQGCPATITDARDNQSYPLVIIGEQVWLGKNLNYQTANSWCYLELPEACQKAGRLYTWEAAKQACPDGWHLPSQEEWDQLLENFGGEGKAAYQALIQGGTAGFDALLGGYRTSDGSFLSLGVYGSYWSATERDGGSAVFYNFYGDTESLYRYDLDQSLGLSVRCLQN